MTFEEHPNIVDADWRLQAITTLSKPAKAGGALRYYHPVGTPVKAVLLQRPPSLPPLIFGTPNVSALVLDFSNQLWTDSDEDLRVGLFEQPKSGTGDNARWYPKNDTGLFDFFERRMSSIVFAYTALEAFANATVPKDFTIELPRPDGKYLEKYNKWQIERHLSLDRKLQEILPVIKNVSPPPRGEQLWNNYKLLKKLRDRIVHPRSEDEKPEEADNKDSVWNALLNPKLTNPATDAKNIIGYFLANDKRPRWFEKAPF